MNSLTDMVAVTTVASRHEGCDRCGVGADGLPISGAELVVSTPAGPIMLCREHHATHKVEIFKQRMWVQRLSPDPDTIHLDVDELTVEHSVRTDADRG